ncbi:MAG: diguanylate cyclase, partial [Oceanicoccus sp.]|nr:diguanylate cyclase [Oceanicoccus sp.]
ESKDLKLTASIGIATFPKYAQSWQDLLEVADSAMYAAKKAGRNQVKTP